MKIATKLSKGFHSRGLEDHQIVPEIYKQTPSCRRNQRRWFWNVDELSEFVPARAATGGCGTATAGSVTWGTLFLVRMHPIAAWGTWSRREGCSRVETSLQPSPSGLPFAITPSHPPVQVNEDHDELVDANQNKVNRFYINRRTNSLHDGGDEASGVIHGFSIHRQEVFVIVHPNLADEE